MLQQHPHFFLSQPMIYFGANESSDSDESIEEIEENPFEIQFSVDPFVSTQQNIGLFIHWYDLPS